MDLTGWTFILTFGKNLDIYGRGEERVGIDRDTGRVVMSYTVGKQFIAKLEGGELIGDLVGQNQNPFKEFIS